MYCIFYTEVLLFSNADRQPGRTATLSVQKCIWQNVKGQPFLVDVKEWISRAVLVIWLCFSYV